MSNAVPSENQDQAEEGKYGEPRKYDVNFKGPIKSRSCTDIACCLVFLSLVTGMVICTMLGLARGNPYKLIYPTDSSGNICGQGTFSNRPHLVYFDILKCTEMGKSVLVTGCPTPQVCVANCPSNYWAFSEAIDNKSTNGLICKSKVDINTKTWRDIQTLVQDNDCAPYYFPSTPILGRCIPSFFLNVTDYAATLNASSEMALKTETGEIITVKNISDASYFLAKIYSIIQDIEIVCKDIFVSGWSILLFLGMATILCFIWTLLLCRFAGIITYITAVLILGLLICAIYYSFSSQFMPMEDQNFKVKYELPKTFVLNFNFKLKFKYTWLIIGCAISVLTFICLLIFIFICKRFSISIALIKEASQAFKHMNFILIWPLIPVLLQALLIACMGISVVYISTMGLAESYTNGTYTTDDMSYYIGRTSCSASDSTSGSACEFVKYGGWEYIIPIQVFMLFMFLWLNNFIIAVGQMVLAGAFASYYWAFEKPKDIPAFPLTKSVWRSIRYHTGTLALGSLILPIICFVCRTLENLQRKLKGNGNPVTTFAIKCPKCYFSFLKKCSKFDENSYVITAVYGRSFCSACRDAYCLLSRNKEKVDKRDYVSDFILFLNKLMITIAVAIGADQFFEGKIESLSGYVPKLNVYLIPVIVITLGTYFICCCFFSVYTMAVDTLFLCFLEDLEMHDGSPERPYVMSTQLMKILKKKNFESPDNKK